MDLSNAFETYRKENIPPAALLRAAWAILLQKYANTSDISYLHDANGYVQVEAFSCNASTTSLDLLHILSKSTGEDRASLTEHDGLNNEVLSNTAILENVPEHEDPREEIILHVDSWTQPSKLTLHFWDRVLSEQAALRVADTFSTVLEILARNRSVNVMETSIISSRDSRQIMDWNRDVPVRTAQCVHNLLAVQFEEIPHNQAIQAWDGCLTYAELDRLSDRLAARMQDLGVGPEVLVPLCFDKSMWNVVAQIAVLKAGGACVSIDPKTPLDRLKAILDDVKAGVVITTPAHRDLFREAVGEVVAIAPETFEQCYESRSGNVKSSVQPTNAAFVVFTSGSTGKPKGIVTEHHAFCLSAHHQGLRMEFGRHSRALQFAAYTFDVSLHDVFVTLIHGGCVCIPSDETRSGNLSGFIREARVNYMCLTSTVLGLLEPSEITEVQTVVVGGEPMRREDIETWAGEVRHLGNVYGPAECAVWCLYNGGLPPGADPTNIGRAMGCCAWIVDPTDHNKLSVVGCVGELLIEGHILARGYLNQPAKTQEAFLSSPPWAPTRTTPTRFYKTGDMVRYNDDGSISFVGRRDSQVKVNGQRVELGEIQFHLKRCLPFVRDAAVEVIQPGGGKQVLAAFLEPEAFDMDRETFNCEIEASRDAFQTALPEYMIPSLFLPVEKLPQTVSGKLDRKALRERGHLVSGPAFDSAVDVNGPEKQPKTSAEERLASFWATVLGIAAPTISPDANFFRMGADSLAAMKLSAACRRNGLLLPYAEIMRRPTLSAMALAVCNEQSVASVAAVDPLPFSLLHEGLHLKQVRAEVAAQCGVHEDDVEDMYPCTPLQEGIVALSQKQHGTYVGTHVFELPSHVDLARFKAAWDHLVACVAILRTRIVHCSAGIMQVVLRRGPDWRSSNHHASTLFEADGDHSIFGKELCGFSVARQDGKDCFFWTAHHAIYDGWSLDNICKQLNDLYHRVEPTTPAPQFSRFISHLQSAEVKGMRNFWEGELNGCSQVPFPSLPSVGYDSRTNSFETHMITTPRIAHDAVISMRIRSAWSLLIAAYQNSEDVVFGATVSGRAGVDPQIMESMIGPTMTTVPVRVLVDKNKSVGEFLDETKEQAVRMTRFEHAGLQSISRWGEDCRTACSFQSLVVVQPQPEEPGVNDILRHPGADDILARGYALMLECQLRDDGVLARASFDTEVLDALQVRRMLAQLDGLMQQLSASDPSRPIGTLTSASPEDVATVLSWNRERPLPVEHCVHTVVHEQALRTPDEMAVCAWDGQLTYRMLDELSSSIARRLKEEYGLGPEQFVPLCFEKSLWSVVVELATLKAGTACVSIDPAHPLSRLEQIMHDVDATVIITSRLNAHLFEAQRRRVIIVDQAFVDATPRTASYSCSAVRPHNAAFVVFTSGSTGRPKGICQDHAAYSLNMLLQGRVLGTGPGRRVLQFAAHTFDAFLSDVFTALAFGGCVCIPSDAERLNDLAGSIARLRVNQTLLTPSVVKTLRPEDCPSLQVLILSGEPLTAESLRLWGDKTRLINLYGPSECTIWATYRDNVAARSDPRNIGRGAGALIWVTHPEDPDRLTAIGAVGEMLIDGPGLAKGYLKDDEKTAKAFIPAPSWYPARETSPGRVLYRTGDLVRYNADGTICIIGRRDTQVKIRGQRTEISEVEHHVRQHIPRAVGEVGVEMIHSADDSSLQVLAAFVAPKLPDHPDSRQMQTQFDSMTEGIEAKLSRTLPRWMVPSAYILMETLPVTMHGKLDRAALRRFGCGLTTKDLARSIAGDRYVKELPTTANEKALQELWAEVLNLSRATIGVEDHFIRLGGDSIRAMTLVALARRKQFVLSVADVFRCPTLREQSEMLKPVDTETTVASKQSFGRDIRSEVAESLNLPVDAVQDVFPAAPIQEALMTLTEKQTGAYTSRYLFRLPGTIDLERLRTAWAQAIQMHKILRTRLVQTKAHGLVQAVLASSLRWETISDLDAYVKMENAIPFGFGSALVRVAVSEEDQDDKYLAFTAHHAAYDGWYLSRLFDDVSARYRGLEVPPPVDYSRFIHYLSDLPSSDSEKYWKKSLEGAASPSFPSPPDAFYVPMPFRKLSRKLRVRPHALSSATIATVVQTAWLLIVARQSEADEGTCGIVLAGRSVPVADIEAVAGPTITAVPFRVCFERNDTLESLLQRVQTQNAEQMQHQHLGLQNISVLSPDARRACSFQTIITINHGRLEPDQAVLGSLVSDEATDNFYTYPLLLECDLHGDSLEIRATHDEKMISHTAMTRILQQFDHVIQQLCTLHDDQRVCDLEFASPEETRELISLATVPPAVDDCIHHMIHRMALSRANELAVDAWDGAMTYEELDSYASRVASRLQSRGIQRGDVVPVCFEKSKWAIVSMLAVAKAGAAFLALDSSHPRERLRTIVAAASPKLIVCSPTKASVCASLARSILEVDGASVAGMLEVSDMAAAAAVLPSDPLYVIFTSGSTGTPKGTVISHSAYSSVVEHHRKALHFRPGIRVFQFSSFAFDASILEIVTTLAVGGCVCVPSEDSRVNDIASEMNRMSVQWTLLTPSVADFLDPDQVPGLEVLVLGGEPMKASQLQTWADRVRLINAFGPSECSVVVLANSNLSTSSSPSNIGQPVGVACWVVEPDNSDRLVPFGTVGELLVEGPTLFTGYLNDRVKTSTALVDDPSWGRPADDASRQYRRRRLYKTGDLVRSLPDGSLSFVGRKDSQIKLHGQRTELGEIEAHLLSCPDVGNGLVLFPRAGPFADRLVAVVELHSTPPREEEHGEDEMELLDSSGNSLLTSELSKTRDELARSVPLYMVPGLWVVVKRVPVTSTGKLDRNRVFRWFSETPPTETQMRLARSDATQAHQPETLIQREVQKVVATVLKLSPRLVDMSSSILNLGGDSISAMRIVSSLKGIGISTSLHDVLRSPSLYNLSSCSKWISEQLPNNAAKSTSDLFGAVRQGLVDAVMRLSASGIDPRLIEDAYPCTPMQKHFLSSQNQNPQAYRCVSIYELEPQPGWPVPSVEQVSRAWQHVVQRHTILRTLFVEGIRDHEAIQVVLTHAPHDEVFRSIQCSSAGCGAVEAVSQLEHPQFDSPQLPHRLTICHDEHGSLSLRLDISHALTDGPSLLTILKDLGALLENDQRAQQHTRTHSPPPSPYGTYVEYLHARDTHASITFWKHYLQQTPRCMYLPPRPTHASTTAAPTPTFATYKFHLPQSAAALQQLCQSLSVTTSALFRALWALVLRKHVGADDVSFGYLVAGRNMDLPDQALPLAGVVGPVLNLVPCRVRVTAATTTTTTFADVVRQMQVDGVAAVMEHGLVSLPEVMAGGEGLPFDTLLNLRFFDDGGEGEEGAGYAFRDAGGEDPMDYALVLAVQQDGEGRFEIHLNYWEPCVTEEDAHDIATYMKALLEEMVP
ncbi:nonribosomal peptide [Diplodia corticola]|uniref:Nonribosomal peptide n=1 Tax=Diplodia corticola TaxID=236234 RepID=A0A1J9S2G6_9PEZI|nr:nonribosomal peptide [Diplodia corticola]OJD33837.1 nonribosomal peptide [Diplodia corticola]